MKFSIFDNDPAMAIPLSHYLAIIGNTLRSEPKLAGAWVTSELSDVRRSGGHCYMELIEKNPEGATTAKIRATIWAGKYNSLNAKFLKATGREIATGLRVMVQGSATFHAIYGLSFNITDIDPTYTLGDLERIRKEILDALARQGVLNLNKEVPMPSVPQRIAIVSAPGAAGYGDFMTHLETNPYGFKFYTHLFPAVMQGENTAASVIAALEQIEQSIDFWDCVVIIRGGGATTDLNGFDNLSLAYAVATYPLPIIVGIGHERDRTVLDEIANTRQKTPTAVAAYLIDRLAEAYSALNNIADGLAKFVANRLHGEKLQLANAEAVIKNLPQKRVAEASSALNTLAAHLPIAVKTGIAKASDTLSRAATALQVYAHRRADRERANLKMQTDRLRSAATMALSRRKLELENAGKLIDALTPANTLRRGYSITRLNGRAITAADALRPGDIITTTLADGSVHSEIVCKEEEK